MTRKLLGALSPFALFAASCSPSVAGDSPPAAAASAVELEVKQVASFNEPWAMAILPGVNAALVTEKSGKLKLVNANGSVVEVAGGPQVDYGGQGGFGDVVLAPDFAQSGHVYLTWAEAGQNDTRGAALGRAKLVMGGQPRLEGLEVLWRQAPKVTGRGHYSHRIAFSPDGKYLFLASGDRQKMDPAQDLTGNLGKVLRLNLDGTAAAGNPFAAQGGVSAEIWSYGHHNILGMAFDPQGRLWDLEHGPAGGDELNLVQPGKNYGWPVVSEGDHYDGKVIPPHSTRPDMAPPALAWTPVIAPGNFIFYRGDLFSGWKGQAVIAGLGSQGLVRVALHGDMAHEVARHPLGSRVRQVNEAADGSLWVLTDRADGKLLRVAPKGK